MSRWAHEHPDDPEMEGLMDRLDWHRDLPQDERPATPQTDSPDDAEAKP